MDFVSFSLARDPFPPSEIEVSRRLLSKTNDHPFFLFSAAETGKAIETHPICRKSADRPLPAPKSQVRIRLHCSLERRCCVTVKPSQTPLAHICNTVQTSGQASTPFYLRNSKQPDPSKQGPYSDKKQYPYLPAHTCAFRHAQHSPHGAA
jgi:hypothetical protein